MESTICDLLLAFLIRSNPWTPTVVCRAAWALAKMLIIAVGLSRLYLAVDYPRDVFGAFLAGVGWLALCGATRRFFVARRGLLRCRLGGGLSAYHRLDRHPS